MISEINLFLEGLSYSARNTYYNASITMFAVVILCITTVYSVRFTKIKKTIAWVPAIGGVLFVIILTIANAVEIVTDSFVMVSGVTCYIPYLISCSAIMAWILKQKVSDVMDWIAPSYVLGRSVQTIGCTFAGCCHGPEVEWGIYSAVAKTNVFPLQALETVTQFFIWTILHICICKRKFTISGVCAAVATITFGAFNFLTDIFCIGPVKEFYSTSVEGVFAFLTMCAGLIMLYVFTTKAQKSQVSQQKL